VVPINRTRKAILSGVITNAFTRRAPGVNGALVVSLRGGDFLLDCGQDLAIGYHAHDVDSVHLYLVESFSFRVATPEAAVALPSN